MTIKEFVHQTGGGGQFVFNSTQPLTRTPVDLLTYYFAGRRVNPSSFPLRIYDVLENQSEVLLEVAFPESFDQEEISLVGHEQKFTEEDRLWFNAPHVVRLETAR